MEDNYRHKGLRRALIAKLKSKGIVDIGVLEAIGRVPRHFFLDKAFLEHAYQDKAFPIGDGQTISQPYTVARQTELLEIRKGDKVLEIGTGSGYQCCVLLEMQCVVFTVERIENLYLKAKMRLSQMGYYPNMLLSDGTLGWKSAALFDKILITAGAPKVPDLLLEQLRPGGIMIVPVGNEKKQQMLKIIKDQKNMISIQDCGDFSFVPLKGKDGW